MASKRFAKKISKRIGKFTMVLLFVVLVPGWILLYLIAYFLFSIDLCGKLYVDNKDKANACYDKHFRLLLKMDKHELINMFTKNRILQKKEPPRGPFLVDFGGKKRGKRL